MDELKIERLGGLAGLGGPSSRIASRGRIGLSELSPRDRGVVEDLFQAHAKGAKVAAPPLLRDGFRYRIARIVDGRAATIEVPESAVPQTLIDCVKDELI